MNTFKCPWNHLYLPIFKGLYQNGRNKRLSWYHWSDFSHFMCNKTRSLIAETCLDCFVFMEGLVLCHYCSGKEGISASTTVSDVYRYIIIRNLLDSVVHIRWEPKWPTRGSDLTNWAFLFCKVAHSWYNILSECFRQKIVWHFSEAQTLTSKVLGITLSWKKEKTELLSG
jgi:hypothetical protein